MDYRNERIDSSPLVSRCGTEGTGAVEIPTYTISISIRIRTPRRSTTRLMPTPTHLRPRPTRRIIIPMMRHPRPIPISHPIRLCSIGDIHLFMLFKVCFLTVAGAVCCDLAFGAGFEGGDGGG